MKADPAERRRVLLQIMDGEESTRLTLEKAITEMDYGNKKTITFKNLETAVSKIVRNVNYNDLSNYASNFKYTADTISYQRLLEDYNDFKKKRNEYLDILDTIYRKLSNAGTGLLELLEDSDPKRTRYLDKYVFKHVIENIGVNNFKLDDQSFMDFVPSTEKGIDYTSFYDDFCAFIRKIGKNPDDLKKDAYMRGIWP